MGSLPPPLSLSLPHPPAFTSSPGPGATAAGPPGLAEAQQTHLPSGIPAHTSCLPCPGTRLASIGRCRLAPAPGCAGMSLGNRALSQAGGWDGAPKFSPKQGPAPWEHPSLAGQRGAALEAAGETNRVGTPTSCATSHLEMLRSAGVQPPLDKVSAEKATRSQQGMLRAARPCIATS